MARIPQETIDAMKCSVDLVALVRAHGVELTRSGKNWKGREMTQSDTQLNGANCTEYAAHGNGPVFPDCRGEVQRR